MAASRACAANTYNEGMTANPIIQLALEALEIEREALAEIAAHIQADAGASFGKAVQICLDCKGRMIIMGMGKSGHVGRKIAATLASTGTPAFFVHPAEASHGDLGMVTSADVVLAISNSGESTEITSILPLIKRMGAPLIAMTGGLQSSLALHADVLLNSGVSREACP